MRIAMLALATLSLTACQQAGEVDDTPSDEIQLQETPNTDPNPPGVVRLMGDGVQVTGAAGTSLAFTSPQGAVEAELARALGDPTGRASNDECGAGPVDTTSFNGGLKLNFQKGRLVGWVLDTDKGAETRDIATVDRIAPGSSAADLGAAYEVSPVEGSTLGDEFTTQSGISGFYEQWGEAKQVGMLYAGTTCFFR